jgi:hypothetical protein
MISSAVLTPLFQGQCRAKGSAPHNELLIDVFDDGISHLGNLN